MEVTEIELTTNMGCRNMCVYCPQDKILEAYQSKEREMTLENLKRYMSTVPKPTEVQVAGFSEPLAAKDIAEMLKFLSDDGRKLLIFTTLQGVPRSVIRRVFSLPNLFVRFHFPDISGNSKMIVTPELIKNFEVAIRMIENNGGCYLSCCWGELPKEMGHLVSKIEHCEDVNTLTDFSGNVEIPWHKFKRKKGKIECGRTCKHIILPDGRVSMCAQDWTLDYLVGDLNTQTFEEITYGDINQDFQRRCLTENEEIICRNCSDSKYIEEGS